MNTINYLTNYVSTSTVCKDGKMQTIDLNNVETLNISLKGLNVLRVEGVMKDKNGNSVPIEGLSRVRTRRFSKLKNKMLHKPSYCFFLYKNENNEFVETPTV